MNRLLLLLVSLACTWQIATAQNYQVTAVGFYNFENLFDTLESVDVLYTDRYINGEYPYMETIPKSTMPEDFDGYWSESDFTEWLSNPWTHDTLPKLYFDKRDDDFTAQGSLNNDSEVYHAKLSKLADVVAGMGTNITPDGAAILGIAEVEQRSVIEDFVKQEQLKGRDYQIIHHTSMDFRGIDVALIYQPKYFQVEQYTVLPVEIYYDNGNRQFTRDILWVEGLLNGEKVHVFVNHWPSRSGGEQVTTLKRQAAAQVCKDVLDSLRKADPNVQAIVMGDMNDDPISPSMAKILRATGKKDQISKQGLYNPFSEKYKKGTGTTAWRDAWSLFDQIVVSPGLLEQDGFFFYKAEIYNKPNMIQSTGVYRGYPFRSFISGRFSGGYSDHFPVLIYLVKQVE